MADDSKKRLRIANIVFWVLLLYIIAALIWWAIMLLQQNATIYELQKAQISNSAFDQASPSFKAAIATIENQRRRDTAKYIGEGAIFLLLIIIGAVYIFRSVRRQFRLQLQQQNFMMAITHELKTPLSVARLNLETMQRYALDDERRNKLVHISLQETMRLDTLINNILVLAQIDAGAYHSSKEDIDLSMMVTDTLAHFKSRYSDKNIIASIEPGVELTGDPLLLKLLVSNLLENANKYSGKQTSITCNLFMKENVIVLQVIDEGIGIADDEKKNVFKKFYRIGNEQTRRTKGTGLGLYLCKKIADHHNATITLTDNTPTGSNFTVQFFV